jgi:hypothetical protein
MAADAAVENYINNNFQEAQRTFGGATAEEIRTNLTTQARTEAATRSVAWFGEQAKQSIDAGQLKGQVEKVSPFAKLRTRAYHPSDNQLPSSHDLRAAIDKGLDLNGHNNLQRDFRGASTAALNFLDGPLTADTFGNAADLSSIHARDRIQLAENIRPSADPHAPKLVERNAEFERMRASRVGFMADINAIAHNNTNNPESEARNRFFKAQAAPAGANNAAAQPLATQPNIEPATRRYLELSADQILTEEAKTHPRKTGDDVNYHRLELRDKAIERLYEQIGTADAETDAKIVTKISEIEARVHPETGTLRSNAPTMSGMPKGSKVGASDNLHRTVMDPITGLPMAPDELAPTRSAAPKTTTAVPAHEQAVAHAVPTNTEVTAGKGPLPRMLENPVTGMMEPVQSAPLPASKPAPAAVTQAHPETTISAPHTETPAVIATSGSTAPKLPYFSTFATSTTAKVSASGTSLGGTAYAAYGLYNQLKPGGTLEHDMNSGNAAQAGFAQAGVLLNTTALAAGLTSAASDTAMVFGKAPISGSQIAGKLVLPVGLVATGAEVAAAYSAVDGHRATRAVGGLAGAATFGAIGAKGGGALAGPPGAVIGGGVLGLAGALGVGELANTAAGDYVQNKFEVWNQEGVDKMIANAMEVSSKPVPELTANPRITELQTKFLEARQHLEDTVNKYGFETTSGARAISEARSNLIKTQVEINKEWFADIKKNSYELATTYDPLLSAARQAGLKADAEAGRTVFSDGSEELQRQLNVKQLEAVHNQLSGTVNRAMAGSKALSDFAMQTNHLTTAIDDQIKNLALIKSYDSSLNQYDRQQLADLSKGKDIHSQYFMKGIDPSQLNDTNWQLAALINGIDPKVSEAAAQAKSQGVGLQGKATSDGKVYTDGQPETVPQTKATAENKEKAPPAARRS